MIDEFILKNQLPNFPAELDEEDIPDENASCASTITTLDLLEKNITSIIWATGFNNDFGYIKLPVLDTDGKPRHKDGISDIRGLYFLGLPWLRTQKSVLICGIKDDAEFIIEKVFSHFLQSTEQVEEI